MNKTESSIDKTRTKGTCTLQRIKQNKMKFKFSYFSLGKLIILI